MNVLENPLELLLRLTTLMDGQSDLPDADTPLGRLTREFFENNWQGAQEGLLSKTRVIRVWPHTIFAPRVFHFEIDCRYKRKRPGDPFVELADGPLCGQIIYRADLYLADPEQPSVAVLLDRQQAFFHPNYSRRHGVLCLGHLPAGPYPLEDLLEHLYGIITYQNRTPTDALDPEAAQYFALEPEAMAGLEPVAPLY